MCRSLVSKKKKVGGSGKGIRGATDRQHEREESEGKHAWSEVACGGFFLAGTSLPMLFMRREPTLLPWKMSEGSREKCSSATQSQLRMNY